MPYSLLVDGATVPFKSVVSMRKYAYKYLLENMKKWGGEVKTLVGYDPNRNPTYYFGRMQFRGKKITYCHTHNHSIRIKADGSTTVLTKEEKALIYKVENNPKNW